MERDRVPHANALGTRYSKPSRMVFDIDLGEGVSWPDIQEAALLVRGMLEYLGMRPFLKTSGGKGLHVWSRSSQTLAGT